MRSSPEASIIQIKRYRKAVSEIRRKTAIPAREAIKVTGSAQTAIVRGSAV